MNGTCENRSCPFTPAEIAALKIQQQDLITNPTSENPTRPTPTQIVAVIQQQLDINTNQTEKQYMNSSQTEKPLNSTLVGPVLVMHESYKLQKTSSLILVNC